MEHNDMIALWKFYDESLKQSLMLNTQNAEDITRLKVQSFLSSMKPAKIFTILTGIVWVGFVDVLLVKLFHTASPFFLVSMGIQVLLTKLAIIVHLYQLILLHQTDISEPILVTQKKIARIRSSTLWMTRLLFLQFPVWTTFYLSRNMLEQSNGWQLAIQFLVTGVFTWFALWAFFNIKYENRNKKWFRLIFRGKEWIPVIRSMELLEQVNEYKEEKEAIPRTPPFL